MFLGTHTPRLDDKGRLFLPAKYREELAGGLVITKGQERCLYVFPRRSSSRITEALRTAPVTAKAVRDYSRVFFASASDEVPDKQGRITIPPALREYAGAAAGLRRDRRQHAAGDLGRRGLGGLPGRAGGRVLRRPRRRCCPAFCERCRRRHRRARRGLHPRLGDQTGWRHFPGARRTPGPRVARMGTWPGTRPGSGSRAHPAARWQAARRKGAAMGTAASRAPAGHGRPGPRRCSRPP